jgi:hypothetical protein
MVLTYGVVEEESQGESFLAVVHNAERRLEALMLVRRQMRELQWRLVP